MNPMPQKNPDPTTAPADTTAPMSPTTGQRHEIISEYTILPTGMQPGDINAHVFAVKITYRGEPNGRSGGGYSINVAGQELSRAGNWGFPQRFQRWQYRWESFEEALDIARTVVDQFTVMGRTWAEHEAGRAAASAGDRSPATGDEQTPA